MSVVIKVSAKEEISPEPGERLTPDSGRDI
jgi:hypothetical protein